MEQKVIFIAGHSRGGSTLLAMLLGQLEGYFAAGEIHRIWQGGFIDNELCTCGQPFRSCEFWNAVVQEAFGGWNGIDPDEMNCLRKTLYPAKRFPLLAFPSLNPSEARKKTKVLLDAWDVLYKAIRKVSNCQVIVDSSKVSMHGVFLSQVPQMDLHTIHLNRHSCAVAYSKQKKKQRGEVYWETRYMSQRTPFYAARCWIERNFSAESTRVCSSRYLHLQYETLADKPIESLRHIADRFCDDAPDLSYFVDDHTVVLKESHMFGGNSMRFRGQEKQIRLDDEWRVKMPFWQKFLIVSLTWPLLLRYGYF